MQQVRVQPQIATAVSSGTPDYAGARRWLWRTLTILMVGTFVGTTWDSVWHMSVPFDGFWSPPHIAIYVTCAAVAFIIMGMLFTERLRRAFGGGFAIGVLPFKVPGALFILGGGMVMLGFAGAVLDNLWHTHFGLDETNWSLPHNMIGTSLLLVTLGFVSCRLAMTDKRVPWPTKLLLGMLVVMLAAGPLLGPIGNNRTPDSVRFFFSYIPSLAQQPEAQHTFRIYDAWNLNRSHPALLLLAPLWLGAALAFLRRLDGRWWLVLAAMTLYMGLDSGDRDLGKLIAQYVPGFADEGNWRGLPVFLPTLVLIMLPRLRVPERAAYMTAGLLFALMIHNIWGGTSAAWLLAVVGAPLTLVGKALGERTYVIVERPWALRAVLLLVAGCAIISVLAGAVDLYLRLNTP